jgi:signal transduction histidine kinase
MTLVTRRQRAAAAAAWLLVLILALPAVVLTVLAWRYMATGDAISCLGGGPAAVLYATLGALIVRRAGNRIGWFLLGAGFFSAVNTFGSAYAVLGLKDAGSVPGPTWAAAAAQVSFVPLILGLAYMFLLFPSGHLPSRRWRPAGACVPLIIAAAMAATALGAATVALPTPGGVSATTTNPLSVPSLSGPLSAMVTGPSSGLWAVFLALLAVSTAALVVRYRAGGTELRQQIKWLALAAAVMIACALVVLVTLPIAGTWPRVLTTIAEQLATVIGLAGFPIAIAVAVLKYGLYQIDVIISRAVSFGLVSAALTAVYVSIVVGIGTLAGYAGGPVLTVAAAVVVAVLFHPVRQRATRLANRLVYGERKSAYQVLADFAGDMAGQLDAGTALDRMAMVLAGATGAERVEVWVLVDAELRPAAIWPAGAAAGATAVSAARPGPPSRTVGVFHQGERLGVITVVKARNEPVTAADDKLLADLASQAGLVLRNARLTAELRATIDDLRASRRRLVGAQDEERQRIERNLHDGAQQQLVSLSVRLAILEAAADDPAEVRELAGELRNLLRDAVAELRALARGIYPPLLADQGLSAALRAQADRVPLPVAIDADGVGRYPRDIEAAVYFCVLEALQNVAKYAAAGHAVVTLTPGQAELTFGVTDDGTGFDPAAAGTGSGLQGMADRIAAVGGSLRVRSAPGTGTSVIGTVPVPVTDHAPPGSRRPPGQWLPAMAPAVTHRTESRCGGLLAAGMFDYLGSGCAPRSSTAKRQPLARAAQ